MLSMICSEVIFLTSFNKSENLTLLGLCFHRAAINRGTEACVSGYMILLRATDPALLVLSPAYLPTKKDHTIKTFQKECVSGSQGGRLTVWLLFCYLKV